MSASFHFLGLLTFQPTLSGLLGKGDCLSHLWDLWLKPLMVPAAYCGRVAVQYLWQYCPYCHQEFFEVWVLSCVNIKLEHKSSYSLNLKQQINFPFWLNRYGYTLIFNLKYYLYSCRHKPYWDKSTTNTVFKIAYCIITTYSQRLLPGGAPRCHWQWMTIQTPCQNPSQPLELFR